MPEKALAVKVEEQGGINEEFADRDGSGRKKNTLSEGSAGAKGLQERKGWGIVNN